jgi:hypothetical protein
VALEIWNQWYDFKNMPWTRGTVDIAFASRI